MFSKQEFRKSVGCNILAVTYGNKGSRILGKAREYENRKVKRKFKWILMINIFTKGKPVYIYCLNIIFFAKYALIYTFIGYFFFSLSFISLVFLWRFLKSFKGFRTLWKYYF